MTLCTTTTISFGAPGDIPLAGDWTKKGYDSIGVYRPSTSTFYLKNSNSGSSPDIVFTFGSPGDTPVVWSHGGMDSVGIYRGGMFYLRNTNDTGNANISFQYGSPTGDIPIMGDWNTDGTDTPGLFRGGTIFLRNDNSTGNADVTFNYGQGGDLPIVGDWDNISGDSFGIYRNGAFFLKNSNTNGGHDVYLTYGVAGDTPIAGRWTQGSTMDSIGVFRNGVFNLLNDVNCSIETPPTPPPVVHECEKWECDGNKYKGCENNKYMSPLNIVDKCGYTLENYCTDNCKSPNKCWGQACLTPKEFCNASCQLPNVCDGNGVCGAPVIPSTKCADTCKSPKVCNGESCLTLEEYCTANCKSPNTCVAGECTAPFNSPYPVAKITATPTSGTAPLAVKFTNGSTGSKSFSIDFGDKTVTSTELNHTYTVEGTYTVKLTASNGVKMDTVTTTITVAKGQITPPVVKKCDTTNCLASEGLVCGTDGTCGVAPADNTMLIYGAIGLVGLGVLALVLKKKTV